MLLMCGQVAVYILTLFYHLSAARLPGAWHFFALFPPIFTLFVLLPWMCHSFALFDAYAVPNPDIVDAVISDEEARETHAQYIRGQLPKKAPGEAAADVPFVTELLEFERTFDEVRAQSELERNSWLAPFHPALPCHLWPPRQLPVRTPTQVAALLHAVAHPTPTLGEGLFRPGSWRAEVLPLGPRVFLRRNSRGDARAVLKGAPRDPCALGTQRIGRDEAHGR
jgi:hypothetical protein